ncbi:RNA polymerase sigma factor [Bacteroidota bacterium]
MAHKQEDPDILFISSFIKNRDRRSFTALIEKYQHDVYNFCYRFTGDSDDAADCSQEIFIRVYKYLPNFAFRSKFSTWLYRIMVNVCNDMVKKQAYRTKQVSLDNEILNVDSSGPEQAAIRKEIQEVFQAALLKIRENYRTVIILRDLEGRSYEEIATLTGMKFGTVKSTLARARMEMSGYLKEYRYAL